MLLSVDPGLVIWLWITFGIILVVLRFTAWGAITGGLDRRAQRIASELDAARKAGESAQAARGEREAILRGGREEAARIVEDARVEAARLREESLRATQEEAREARERAEKDIDRAREDAARGLRAQVVDLSFTIAEALLKREARAADTRAFAEELAERLAAGGPAARN